MKMDAKLIALKQKFEVDYISLKYSIPKSEVKKAIKVYGRSRKRVYQALREMGYSIKTKKK